MRLLLVNIQQILDDHDFVLTEAAVIETLRRSGDVDLHPRLENALLIYEEAGKKALTELYEGFVNVAGKADVPIIICTPTWRANKERVLAADLTTDVNGDAVKFLKLLRTRWGSWASNVVIGGLVGCKNDCYRPDEGLSKSEAEAFHFWQITRLAKAGVDFLVGETLPALSEATGIALAMAKTSIPYVISFVIDKEGRILDGNSLDCAFRAIDAACGRPPLGYMINCAYPSFLNADKQPRSVLCRLIGYQANASSLDHSQLDGAGTLQADDISDWGNLMIELNNKFGVKILGGCCGTSCEHLQYIAQRIKRTQAR
jgi:homocysteine S-methyltransferase